MAHTDRGADVMDRFAEALAEVANVEKAAKLEGRSMQMTLAAKPASKKSK